MANKQINELPPIDAKAFRPAQDNFIVQKPNGGTARASIAKMIDDPSVNLPGSTDWNWNWLDTPATIAPYHKVDYSMPAFANVDYRHDEEDLPTSSSIGYPNLSNLSYQYDAVTRKPTGIPKNAKSLMCVAFLNNCDLHLAGPRSQPVVTSQRLRHTDELTYGWNSNPVETLFIVNNISRPKNFAINQNTPNQSIQYMEPNSLSFELTFRMASTGFVQFGGSHFLGGLFSGGGGRSLEAPSQPNFIDRTIEIGRQVVGGIAGVFNAAYSGVDYVAFGALPNYNYQNQAVGVDFADSALGQTINAFESINNTFLSGSVKSLDITSNPLVEGLSSLLTLPSDVFSEASDALGALVGKIPIVGPVIEPLLSTREGLQLVLDQAIMARLLNDPGFFYDTFIKRQVIVETSYKKEVAGWELFYIKILAWN